MAIILKKLVKNAFFLYKMKLIAGKKGMNNLVQWVHIIEDDEVSTFLHGYELVFTAGILNKSENWLLDFARNLNKSEVSAFVVNLGPYTKKIPKAVVDYCNNVNMPLFIIPWETRMVDMTRDFCHLIMMNENVENSIATTIKNIIFNIGDLEQQILQMERYGYKRNGRFCFIDLWVEAGDSISTEEYMDELSMNAEKTARRIHELFISFNYKESLVFVLVDYEDEEIECFVKSFLEPVKKGKNEAQLHMGISSNLPGIYNQVHNFEKSISAMEVAKRQNEMVLFYDRLGVYKILYAVNDKSVLRSFYSDTIGLLKEYDRENNTDLSSLLKTYLENNGSLQLVSEKRYIHRNTVTNQLKRIEKITGYNPMDLEDKVNLYLGLYIQDII